MTNALVAKIQADIAALPKELQALIVDHLPWWKAHANFYAATALVVGVLLGHLIWR